jgi:hypothetical protein
MQNENITALYESLKTRQFEMFSKAGDNACRSGVKKIFDRISGSKRITQDALLNTCKDVVKKIKVKYPEVNDTEPAWHIQELTNKMLQEVGYSFEVSRYYF